MLRLIVLILILVCLLQGRAAADETADKCQTLRDLNESYRGRSLSITERAIKAQMVAWYNVNCRTRRGGRSKAKQQ